MLVHAKKWRFRALMYFFPPDAHIKDMKKIDYEDNDFISPTDPEGSYTGNPTLLDEPEQDADDL